MRTGLQQLAREVQVFILAVVRVTGSVITQVVLVAVVRLFLQVWQTLVVVVVALVAVALA
jgi:hypothetical protein